MSKEGDYPWQAHVEQFIKNKYNGAIAETAWVQNDFGVFTCVFTWGLVAVYKPDLDKLIIYRKLEDHDV